jgi:hypothetical protein
VEEGALLPVGMNLSGYTFFVEAPAFRVGYDVAFDAGQDGIVG